VPQVNTNCNVLTAFTHSFAIAPEDYKSRGLAHDELSNYMLSRDLMQQS